MATTEKDKQKKRLSELKDARDKLLGQRVTQSVDLLNELDDILQLEGTPTFDPKAKSLADRLENVNELYDNFEKKLNDAILKIENEISE